MEKFPTQAASAWFPLLPKGWAHSRIKYEVARIGSGGTPNTDDDLLWARDGSGTAWVSIADMSTTDIVNTTERRLTAAGLASKNLETFPPGTLLYSMYASVGKISILGASAAINQAMLAILPDAKKIDARFFRWALEYVSNRILELASTNTQDNLNLQKVRNAFLLRPPIDLQAAIADFLDRETAEADALVAKYERLIELLEEKRVALITRAVTKGLDSSVPMKDSGITWMGEIPTHWGCPATSSAYEVSLGKMLDGKRISGNHLMPYLRVADVQWNNINTEELPLMDIRAEEYHRYLLRTGDLLVCEGGSYPGRSAIWSGKIECGYQKALHRLRARHPDSYPPFMLLVMRLVTDSGWLLADQGKSTIAHIPCEDLKQLRIPFPPRVEQEQIVAQIERTISQLDKLNAMALSAITLLKERRSALITAAVTGQIDISTCCSNKQPVEVSA